MKRENLKPSIITYYQTRASIIHPILAITQVNIGIYLLFASPYINSRFITVSFQIDTKFYIGSCPNVLQTSCLLHFTSLICPGFKENLKGFDFERHKVLHNNWFHRNQPLSILPATKL